MTSDDDLWARCIEGDTRALSVLYERHAQRLYSYLFRATADWSVAEDAVSIVFMEAWRRRAEAQVEAGKVLPWLYGIAANVVRDQKRSLRRYRRTLAKASVGFDDDHSFEDVDARLDDQRRVRELHERLRALSDAEKQVVLLVWSSGLTYEEAAAALDIPVGTVRSRISRARDRLRLDADDGARGRGDGLTQRNPVKVDIGGGPKR